MVQIVFTSSGSFANPGDWNNSDNKIECLGSGGTGASYYSGIPGAGGGGAYGWAVNAALSFPAAITIGSGNATQVGSVCLAQSGTNALYDANGVGGSGGSPQGYAGGNGSSGAGGAAGPAGAGGAGDNMTGNGGAANAGTTPGGNIYWGGNNGSEWGLYGCGSGGGYGAFEDGGSYGGGSAGNPNGLAGSGIPGLVVITYTPFVPPAGAMIMVIG